MAKFREDYSESLESQYRRMERIHDKIVVDFDNKILSKSLEEKLDNVYDFFFICYHLREWVQKDSKVNQIIKDKLPTFEKDDSPVQLQMCRDLCNKSKHAILDKTKWHKPNDVNTKIIPYGSAIFKVSTKEIEEAQKKKENIHLKSEDSIFTGDYLVVFKKNQYDLKGVIQACMYVWREFFEKNELILPRSTPFQ